MKVTDKAIEQFETAIKQFDSPIAGIRVFAGSGCCGPAVELSLVEKAATGDVVINIQGIDFFIEGKAEEMMKDVSIDFRDNGFRMDGIQGGGGCCG
jgi:Fe-S cluster assembly iron-binding protein IscA